MNRDHDRQYHVSVDRYGSVEVSGILTDSSQMGAGADVVVDSLLTRRRVVNATNDGRAGDDMVGNLSLSTDPAYKMPMFSAAVTTQPLLTGDGARFVTSRDYHWRL